MYRRSQESGQGKLGCAIWLALLVFFVYVAYQAVPIKVKSAELEEFMVRQAESASNSKPELIHKRVLRRAQDLELPVDKKKLKVIKRSGRVVIDYEYSIPISLLVYTYDWEYKIHIDRPFFDV